LHFVTAREAYNIVKAAEAGHSGNPNDYRDYLIPPPANRLIRCNRPWRLRHHSRDRVCLELGERGPATVDFATGPLRSVWGKLERITAQFDDWVIRGLDIEGDEVGVETITATGAGGKAELLNIK